MSSLRYAGYVVAVFVLMINGILWPKLSPDSRECKWADLPEWRRETRIPEPNRGAPKFSDSIPVRTGASGKARKSARPKTGCSPECREKAVKPLIETSRPIAKVSKELVVNAGTLSNWVKAYPRKHVEKELRET
jgi:hypothetical protein